MELFLSNLAFYNGGKRSHMEKEYPDYENSEMREVIDTTDERVIDGKVYVDWVNFKIKVLDDDMNFRSSMSIKEVYSMKKQPRVKKVEKLKVVKHNSRAGYADEEMNNPVSSEDKFSHKCAFCGQVWGYRERAQACSKSHHAEGLITGDLLLDGITEVVHE
jgi:hypothetical protein